MVGHSWKSCFNRAADEFAADRLQGTTPPSFARHVHAASACNVDAIMRVKPAGQDYKVVFMCILHVVDGAKVEPGRPVRCKVLVPCATIAETTPHAPANLGRVMHALRIYCISTGLEDAASHTYMYDEGLVSASVPSWQKANLRRLIFSLFARTRRVW
jgi:hypothetical protein